MAEHNSVSSLNDSWFGESFDGSLSDSEIVINYPRNKAKDKRAKRKKKQTTREEEVVVHTQFTGFGDGGTVLKKPCSVKINASQEEAEMWVEGFRHLMKDYSMEEKSIQHGQQFVFHKNEGKFISATVYKSGTVLVQGLSTCVIWKDKYLNTFKDFVSQQKRSRPVTDTETSSQTIEKEMITSNNPTQAVLNASIQSHEEETTPKQIINIPMEGNTNVLGQYSTNEQGESKITVAIEHILVQLFSLNKKLDDVSSRSDQLKNMNTELENQTLQLKSLLKLEQQKTKSLQDEITIQNVKIRSQEEEIASLNLKLLDGAKSKPKADKKSFHDGISNTSTPINVKRIPREKREKTPPKKKLPLRKDQKESGNILIIGSSITKRIKTRFLRSNVSVKTNRGATSEMIRREIEDLDLSPFDTIILQFGGNDADRGVALSKFTENYCAIVNQIKHQDPNKKIVIGGVLPRIKTYVGDYNNALGELCYENEIAFVNHLDNFLLRNGRIMDGVLTTDGIHLTHFGTKKLVQNLDAIEKIIPREGRHHGTMAFSGRSWNQQNSNRGSFHNDHHRFNFVPYQQKFEQNEYWSNWGPVTGEYKP